MLGNESMISRQSADSRQSSKQGAGAGLNGADPDGVAVDKADVLRGLKPVNRQSGAVNSESLFEEYSDVVEKYFKAITK